MTKQELATWLSRCKATCDRMERELEAWRELGRVLGATAGVEWPQWAGPRKCLSVIGSAEQRARWLLKWDEHGGEE